jgi:hypothetical protein
VMLIIVVIFLNLFGTSIITFLKKKKRKIDLVFMASSPQLRVTA